MSHLYLLIEEGIIEILVDKLLFKLFEMCNKPLLFFILLTLTKLLFKLLIELLVIIFDYDGL